MTSRSRSQMPGLGALLQLDTLSLSEFRRLGQGFELQDQASFLRLLETANRNVYAHGLRTAYLARFIGQQLPLSDSDLSRLVIAAQLHDLGKIYMDKDLLNKPDRLTWDEFEQIKRHPVYGAQLIRTSSSLKNLAPLVLYHHERFDGTGYPMRLTGLEIPLLSRIITVADSLDAMSQPQPYRPQPLTLVQIKSVVESQSGAQFDPGIARLCSALLSQDDGLDSI